jgi:hypothetical protein
MSEIEKVLKAARLLEDYLWGYENKLWGLDEWKLMLRKRLVKIFEIDMEKPHWRVEARKRLVQNIAVSLGLLERLDKIRSSENPLDLPTARPEPEYQNIKSESLCPMCYYPGAAPGCTICGMFPDVYHNHDGRPYCFDCFNKINRKD